MVIILLLSVKNPESDREQGSHGPQALQASVMKCSVVVAFAHTFSEIEGSHFIPSWLCNSS